MTVAGLLLNSFRHSYRQTDIHVRTDRHTCKDRQTDM